MKLALGTVQFGVDYGINNKTGQVSIDEVFKILDFCRQNDINIIDTSYAYGNSESVIGEYLKKNRNNNFKIITKIPENSSKVIDIFNESLQRLGIDKIYGYIIHHFDFFKENPKIFRDIQNLKREGKIEKIGFSLYFPKELEYLFERGINFDIVQFPYSIFDRRFEKYFRILKDKSVEIHIRSVFLQGLVFKKTTELDDKFDKIKDKLRILNQISRDINVSISSLCINYTINNVLIDNVIIGVDSCKNLIENVYSLKDLNKIKLIINQLDELKEDDENIILPINWKK